MYFWCYANDIPALTIGLWRLNLLWIPCFNHIKKAAITLKAKNMFKHQIKVIDRIKAVIQHFVEKSLLKDYNKKGQIKIQTIQTRFILKFCCVLLRFVMLRVLCCCVCFCTDHLVMFPINTILSTLFTTFFSLNISSIYIAIDL